MKTKPVIIIILSAIIVSFACCKKSLEISDSIVGRWKIDSIQLRTLINDQRVYVTGLRPASDYYYFTGDSVLVYYQGMNYPRIHYSLNNFNGMTLIQYDQVADTILSFSKQNMIISTYQGNGARLFFTKH